MKKLEISNVIKLATNGSHVKNTDAKDFVVK
jgi:hypothetical protein